MRQLLRAGLLLVLLIAAAAQRRGFAPMPRPAPPSGNSFPIATPPIPTLPIATPPITTPPGATFGAWRQPDRPQRSRDEQPQVVVVPYATPYPVYVESQAAPTDGDNPQQLPPPDPAAFQPQPRAAPAPQREPAGFAAGVAPCGRAPDPPPALPIARPAARDDPPSFYIAMNDGWVYQARAYWVDKDTLHYITANGRHNQVSLVLVNRDVSTRLNAKRADEFHLPPPE